MTGRKWTELRSLVSQWPWSEEGLGEGRTDIQTRGRERMHMVQLSLGLHL